MAEEVNQLMSDVSFLQVNMFSVSMSEKEKSLPVFGRDIIRINRTPSFLSMSSKDDTH